MELLSRILLSLQMTWHFQDLRPNGGAGNLSAAKTHANPAVLQLHRSSSFEGVHITFEKKQDMLRYDWSCGLSWFLFQPKKHSKHTLRPQNVAKEPSAERPSGSQNPTGAWTPSSPSKARKGESVYKDQSPQASPEGVHE